MPFYDSEAIERARQVDLLTYLQTCEPQPQDHQAGVHYRQRDGENRQDGSSDHVGIVEKVENGRVYTVEGNSGDSVRQNSYPIGYYEIYGYGTPAY